jgi:hypothetical protein
MTMFRLRGRATAEGDLTPEMSSSEGVEASDSLKRFERQYHFDPNLPADEIELVDATLTSGDSEKAIKVEVASVENDSPYPEVYPYLLI